MSDDDLSAEDPPLNRGGRTPAERAGATPLDPERFKTGAGMPTVRRRRVDGDDASPDDSVGETVPVVRRRRSRSNRGAGSARPWFVAAAVLAVVGLLVGVVAFVTEPDTEVAAGAGAETVAATPVLSARRTPETLARPVAARNLRAAVDPVLADSPANSCLEVRDSSNPVVAHNQTQAVVPASNMKLVVAAAALDLLDPESRLSTRFLTDGASTDGSVVRGNLYMVGGGDPLLTTPSYNAQLPNGEQPVTDLEAIADQIVGTGVNEITGSVVGDESRYDTERRPPSWPERFLTQGQAAPLSALLANDAWRSGGGPAPQPATHAAEVLTELLEDRGVEIAGDPTTGTAPEGAVLLTEVPSLTIAELVAEFLRFSDNTTTELMVKEIGLQKGAGGTTQAGLDVIREWIASSGLPAEGVVFDDGSGLSDNDRVTCTFLGALLAEEGPSGVVANGLATPGDPGTLDDRLLGDDLRDRVRAKTGTLRTVTALSGWLRTQPERDVGFSFIINTTDRQVSDSDAALQQRMLESILAYPQTPPIDSLAPLPPAAGGG